MGLGLGGIVASGIAGGIGGAGEGLAATGLLEQKQQIEMMREERLSQLRIGEHAANLQANVTSQIDNAVPLATAQAASTAITGPASATAAGQKVDAETKAKVQNEPVKLNAGESLTKPGTSEIAVTAPIKTPPEQVEYYKGHAAQAQSMAAYYNAQADAIRNGERYKGSQGQLPNVIVEKDIQGNVSHLVDKTSGAIGVVTPAAPGKPGETHWFGPNDPDGPPTPMQVNWISPSGKRLPNGLDSLYPGLSKRDVTISPQDGPLKNDVTTPGPSVTGKIGSGGEPAVFDTSGIEGTMGGVSQGNGTVPLGNMAKLNSARAGQVQTELMNEIANPTPNSEVNIAAAKKEIALQAGKPPVPGWSIMFDARGRAAWVSPDRSQSRPI